MPSWKPSAYSRRYLVFPNGPATNIRLRTTMAKRSISPRIPVFCWTLWPSTAILDTGGKMQMFSALHVGSWTRRTSHRRTRSATQSITRICYVPGRALLSSSAMVIAIVWAKGLHRRNSVRWLRHYWKTTRSSWYRPRGLHHPMTYGARCVKTHGRLWTTEEIWRASKCMGKFLFGLFLEERNGVVVDLICIFTISYISPSLCYSLPCFWEYSFHA